MTTRQSSLSEIKRQADFVAKTLKMAERGEPIDVRFAANIEAARKQPTFTIGIVMDDQLIKMGLPWQLIAETGEVALSEMIVKYIRGTREN